MTPTGFTPSPAPAQGARWAVCADLLDFTADPGWQAHAVPLRQATTSEGVRWRPAHWLMVEGECIVGVMPSSSTPPESFECFDRRGLLLTPGLIDTHVHLPQLGVVASHGTGLLDWLETYTFPAEQAFANPAVAEQGAAVFLDALLAHGTTSAMVFPTVHATSVEALFSAASRRGMAITAGKCLMDRHAPDGLRDDVLEADRQCRALIARWHGHGRQRHAVTVRFAPTSSEAQLAMAGRLLRDHPDVLFQTHLAETQDEVAWVRRLFPSARSYLDVYAQHGLLREGAVLAHAIWLNDADRRALAESGASVSHCPSSNLFLGSGAMPWRSLEAAGVGVSLGSDVGGGTSLSMVRTMADAARVQASFGDRLTAYKALHAVTLGAAQALKAEAQVGSLSVGLRADFCVWHWAQGPVATLRDGLAQHLHERLFAWMMLGDERNLVQAVVSGVVRHQAPDPLLRGPA